MADDGRVKLQVCRLSGPHSQCRSPKSERWILEGFEIVVFLAPLLWVRCRSRVGVVTGSICIGQHVRVAFTKRGVSAYSS